MLESLEIERPVLVGSSMGAATAMAFALDEPESVAALVQITPAYAGAPRTDDLAHWDCAGRRARAARTSTRSWSARA